MLLTGSTGRSDIHPYPLDFALTPSQLRVCSSTSLSLGFYLRPNTSDVQAGISVTGINLVSHILTLSAITTRSGEPGAKPNQGRSKQRDEEDCQAEIQVPGPKS